MSINPETIEDTTTSIEVEDSFHLEAISQKTKAWDDLKESILNWRIWLLLASHDIKLRYRRSVLGPFWITLSMALTVYCMSFLYGHLFRVDIQHYSPYLVASILSWSFISTIIMEQTDAFMTSEIKQMRLPFSLHIHRVTARNYLIFFHNVIVMIPIYFIFNKTTSINLNTLLLIPSFFIIYLNSFFYGLFLAIVGARFRDVSQLIKSLIQIVFFVTPVMWQPSILPEKYHYLVYLNPFYSFLELIRGPLRGISPSIYCYEIVILTTLIGVCMSTVLFIKYRSRIIYWL